MPMLPCTIELLRMLISISSINPSFVPGAPGEEEIADYLAGICERLGLDVAFEEVESGRPNVVAVLPGRAPGQGRTLLLCGHMDTVGITGMERALIPVLQGNRLYGRGADDMKGGLAAMIGAVRAVVDSGRRPLGDVVLAFVVDEEHASLGTTVLTRTRSADAAIVAESTGLRIGIAHKGFVWGTIRTAGRAAHGSDYNAGLDAIAKMGRVLVALERLNCDVLPERRHPLLGRPSVHASLVRGGEGLSTYPPSCELSFEWRTLPGEKGSDVLAALESLLADLRREDPALDASIEIIFERSGYEIDRNTDVVRALGHALEYREGAAAEYIGLSPWFDAALLAGAGIPTAIFGPCGGGAHSATEYVDVPSVLRCANVLAEVIIDFCGAG